PAQRLKVPIDWPHRVPLANPGALENSRHAVEIVIAPGETATRGRRDVGLIQDVRGNRGSQRNKLGGLIHRHSDCNQETRALTEKTIVAPIYSVRCSRPFYLIVPSAALTML